MTLTRVMLDYAHPWPNATGFYVARDRGYYRDAGINVELATHDHGRGDWLDHLLRNEVTFAIFPPNRLLVRRDNRQPLVSIAAITQTGFETIQAKRSSGIERLKDLEGHSIAYGQTPRGKALVAHLIRSDGGDPATVIHLPFPRREYTPDTLLQSDFDAQFGGYWTWDNISRADGQDDLITWRVDQVPGAPRYQSYVLGTQEWTIDANPEFVRAFVQATGRGYRDAATDPEYALSLLTSSLVYIPAWRLAESLALVSTEWFHEGRWGVLRHFEEYANWLHANGIISTPEVWRDSATNEFLESGGN